MVSLGRLTAYLLALASGAAWAHMTAQQAPTASDRLPIHVDGTRHAEVAHTGMERGGAAYAGVTRAGTHGAAHIPQATGRFELDTRSTPAAGTDRDAASAATVPAAELDRRLGAPHREGHIVTGGTSHRLILFTFDDGPDRRTTPLLLDRLDAAGVRAVFFLTANRLWQRNIMEREQALLAREIVRRGHTVGSHGLDHLQLPLLGDAEALAQITTTERVFEQVLGARPWLFRPPGGARSPRIDRMLAERGYTTVLWNLGTGDFQVRTAEEVFDTWKRVMGRREKEYGERGGIVLMHDTYPWSVDAFQRIVAELWDRNCSLLEQGEELYDIVEDLEFFHMPRGAASAGMEARPAEIPPHVLDARQARLRRETAARCLRTASL